MCGISLDIKYKKQFQKLIPKAKMHTMNHKLTMKTNSCCSLHLPRIKPYLKLDAC